MELKKKTEQEIKEIFVPGRTFYVAGDKYHVVNYTTDETEKDDERKNMIVVKSWNKYRNRWCYEVWKWYIFYSIDVCFGYVRLTKKKRKRY